MYHTLTKEDVQVPPPNPFLERFTATFRGTSWETIRTVVEVSGKLHAELLEQHAFHLGNCGQEDHDVYGDALSSGMLTVETLEGYAAEH